MACFYPLKGRFKDYDWGSADFLQQLFDHDGPVLAEYWLGSHPAGEALCLIDGQWQQLHEAAGLKEGGLPFLLKVIAADRALSAQLHPDQASARRGFEFEEKNGPAMNDPQRSFKDPNAKPEMLCALDGGFHILKGMRSQTELQQNLRLLPSLSRLAFEPADELSASANTDLAGQVISRLMNNRSGRLARELKKEIHQYLVDNVEKGRPGEGSLQRPAEVLDFIRAVIDGLKTDRPFYTAPPALTVAEPLAWCGWLAGQYPDDAAFVLPLLLNYCRLEKNDAVFLPAGELHAYLYGRAVELMGNSDNVLRGGLTSKHVDVELLLANLDTSSRRLETLQPEQTASPQTLSAWQKYPARCEQFELYCTQGDVDGAPLVMAEENDTVLLVTAGQGQLVAAEDPAGQANHEEQTLRLGRGDAVFVKAGCRARLSGQLEIFAACAGRSNA